MSLWAVIPAKPASEGKSRLAPVLSPASRLRLNLRLFEHTLATVSAVFAPGRIIVVSRDAALLEIAEAAGARGLRERGDDLNEALHQAAALLPPGRGLLTVSTDLPNLTPDDLRAMLAPQGRVAIAPDRAGTGTNALFTSPAAAIPYAFGLDSFARHKAAAARIGVLPRIISRPGLAFDLDMPEDLAGCPPRFLG